MTVMIVKPADLQVGGRSKEYQTIFAQVRASQDLPSFVTVLSSRFASQHIAG